MTPYITEFLFNRTAASLRKDVLNKRWELLLPFRRVIQAYVPQKSQAVWVAGFSWVIGYNADPLSHLWATEQTPPLHFIWLILTAVTRLIIFVTSQLNRMNAQAENFVFPATDGGAVTLTR